MPKDDKQRGKATVETAVAKADENDLPILALHYGGEAREAVTRQMAMIMGAKHGRARVLTGRATIHP